MPELRHSNATSPGKRKRFFAQFGLKWLLQPICVGLGALWFSGCLSGPPAASPVAGISPGTVAAEPLSAGLQAQLKRTLENEALIEWQIGRLAAACNAVANSTQSLSARREALRLKAAYATSCYAVAGVANPEMQVLDLMAMANLSHLIWVEEQRAQTEFGTDAKPLEESFTEIRARTRKHAEKSLSADQLDGLETMVKEWRKLNPGPAVVEFIRFEALAEELSHSLGRVSDLGGLLGRITGQALDARLLGERLLTLASRTPRIAEWHAESAAANLLAQPELANAVAAVAQLDGIRHELPARISALEAQLSTLPSSLAMAVTSQPEFRTALTRTDDQLKQLQVGVDSLEKSVALLATQLGQLNSLAQPESIRQLAGTAGEPLIHQMTSLVWWATGCAAGVVVLHAVLRRWSRRPPPP
jgi:hypothetical protein